jgi:hypothetical protein
MLAKAAEAGSIKGLCSDICPGGVIFLQYADDTILFSDTNPTYTAKIFVISKGETPEIVTWNIRKQLATNLESMP